MWMRARLALRLPWAAARRIGLRGAGLEDRDHGELANVRYSQLIRAVSAREGCV